MPATPVAVTTFNFDASQGGRGLGQDTGSGEKCPTVRALCTSHISHFLGSWVGWGWTVPS